MNGSTLVIGANTQQIEDYISKDTIGNNKYVHIIKTPEDKKSIGIEQITEGISFLKSAPEKNSTKKIFIINGDAMTVQAQNALLKNLEEPPKYAQITIFTKKEDDVLETIISRCKKIKMNNTGKQTSEAYVEFCKLTLGKRFDWAESTAKLETAEISEILGKLISGARIEFINSYSKKQANNLKILSEIKEDIEKLNVNKRLALENLVIQLII